MGTKLSKIRDIQVDFSGQNPDIQNNIFYLSLKKIKVKLSPHPS